MKLILHLIPILFFTIGLLDLPYSFYMLQRVVLTGVFIVLAFRKISNRDGVFVGYCLLAVFYNLILPVHLGSRVMWLVVNSIVTIFLAYTYFKHKEA